MPAGNPCRLKGELADVKSRVTWLELEAQDLRVQIARLRADADAQIARLRADAQIARLRADAQIARLRAEALDGELLGGLSPRPDDGGQGPTSPARP